MTLAGADRRDIASRLRSFPHLANYCRELKPATLYNYEFVDLLLSQYERNISNYELTCVEQCLERLIQDHPAIEMRDQIASLWGDEHSWDKGTTELLGLDYLNQRNVLDSIGWPKGGTVTPPFDARMCFPNRSKKRHYILVDIKTASHGGLDLVRRRLRAIVEDWAKEKGLEKPDLDIRHSGDVTTEATGRVLGEIASSFSDKLYCCATFPDDQIRVQTSRCSFRVQVRKHTGVSYSSGISGVDWIASSIGQLVLRQAQKKNRQARKLNCGFLLLYVRPNYKGGSDITEDVLCQAVSIVDVEAKRSHIMENWLGVVFLDWTPPFKAKSFFRKEIGWPRGLSPSAVRRALALEEWKVRRKSG